MLQTDLPNLIFKFKYTVIFKEIFLAKLELKCSVEIRENSLLFWLIVKLLN